MNLPNAQSHQVLLVDSIIADYCQPLPLLEDARLTTVKIAVKVHIAPFRPIHSAAH